MAHSTFMGHGTTQPVDLIVSVAGKAILQEMTTGPESTDSTRPVVHNVRDARADWKGEVTTCTTRKSLAAVGLKSRRCNLAEDMHTDACAAEHHRPDLPFRDTLPSNGCCNSLPRPDECKNRGNYGELIRLAVARSVINVAGARNHLWRQATHPSRASPPSCRQRTTLQGTHPGSSDGSMSWDAKGNRFA
ncbi:hypothetical protein Bbelb_415450 [Branchiostoma belcheri]|nr:hypothetical protein Bbelb_415450 [Branchiostoma belcheri]